MLSENLPGTLNAASRPAGSVSDCSALSTSTLTSKVPRMPVSRAVIPLPPWPPPKARPASLAPIATVRVSMPLSNVVPARPIDGPSRLSGPAGAVPELLAAPGASPATVKLAKPRPPCCTGPVPTCTDHEPATNSMSIWPLTNGVVALPFAAR